MRFSLSFRPSLLDALANYDRGRFGADLLAGVTVAIVALPLAMAFAIASGLKPEAGLFTAIIAGFLISALGGSRVQIGGPAGAFIVIVYGIVQRYGLPNLIIATAMSGLMLLAMGLLRLGNLVRFIPVSVVIGFTNGIAVLIILSQIKDFLGLRLTDLPADFFGMIGAIWGAAPSLNLVALLLALGALALISLWERGRDDLRRRAGLVRLLAVLPGSLVALVLAALAVHLLALPVETIGSRFGGIAANVPAFALPSFDWATVRFLLVPASTLALLGAIESLLCARIADNLTRKRHDPNQELMAQGIANIVAPFFGGMPATGTIARTVTNVKSGATSPIAGMVHAAVLLLTILVAAPLADAIPLAALAAMLMHVAWNMGQWRQFANLQQYRLPYRFTLLSVFLLTVVFDLTVAIEVGLIAACLTFIYRISSLTRCERLGSIDHHELSDSGIQAYRLKGALFFGALKLVDLIGSRLPQRTVLIDLGQVIYVDSTGADDLLELLAMCRSANVRLILCGLRDQPRDIAQRSGLLRQLPPTDLMPDINAALAELSVLRSAD